MTECHESFEKIKGMPASDLFLRHDKKNQTIVASDPSSYGKGACIMHIQQRRLDLTYCTRIQFAYSSQKELFRDRKGGLRDYEIDRFIQVYLTNESLTTASYIRDKERSTDAYSK